MGEQDKKAFRALGSIKLTGGTSGGQNVKIGGMGLGALWPRHPHAYSYTH
jgi:hypothetical protein